MEAPTPDPHRQGRGRWLALLPGIVALLAHVQVLAPGYGTAPAAWRDDDLGRLARDDAILKSPWFRADLSYRPIADFTEQQLILSGAAGQSARLVDLLLHAAAALLAYGVLRYLLRDSLFAALGASLFAVLPIHSDLVASASGRKYLLAALSSLGMWLVSLHVTSGQVSVATRQRLIAAFGLLAFGGIFCSPMVLVIVPLLLLQSWILRRRVPWGLLAAMGSVVVAYFLVRHTGNVSWRRPVLFVSNPLVEADTFTRLLNGIVLVGRYAATTVFPIALSADHSYSMISVHSLGSPLLWLRAVAIGGSVVALVVILRRRSPGAALAIGFFVLALLPGSSILYVDSAIFRERSAYLASVAFPILLGLLAVLAARRFPRALVAGLLGCLVLAYGGLSWARDAQWNVSLFLRMTREAPRSAHAYRQEAEAYLDLWGRALNRPEERKRLRAEVEKRARTVLEIYPKDPYGWLLLGRLNYVDQRLEEAVQMLGRSLSLLLEEKAAIPEPKIHLWRGESFWRLGMYREALGDLELYMAFLQTIPAPPEERAFKLRGLARAKVGRLKGALEDFNASVALGPGIPDVWSNRGYCRFLLKDYEGAVADYRRGRTLMEQKGILYRPQGESVWDFLRKAADVYLHMAADARKAGDEEKAKAADAERARLEAEAAAIRARAEEKPAP